MADQNTATQSGPVRRLVGCCGFGGDRRRYVKQLPFVEVQQSFFSPPRTATLTRWRSEAPADFAFTLRAWQLITHGAREPSYKRLPRDLEVDTAQCGHFRATEAVASAYGATRQAAAALAADAILFETPTAFTPTAGHRQNIARFFESIDRDGRLMVWQARGVWSIAEVRRICADLDLVPAVDALQDITPNGDTLYVRWTAPQLNDADLYQLAESLTLAPRAYCVVNTVGMVRDAQRLQALLAEG